MFIGRDRELRSTVEAIREGRFVVLHGEAGTGKTTLVHEAARRAGRTLHVGGSLASLAWIDYLPITRVLRHPPTGTDEREIAAELRDTLGDGLLFLDDLQWADASTRALVPLAPGAVATVASITRGDAGATKAIDTVERAGATIVDLGPLDPADARALVRALHPETTDRALASITERAGGNPLLLEELARGEVSPTLSSAVTRRLAALPRSAHETMAELALLARPAPADVLGPGLEQLRDAELVVETDEGYVVRHSLIASAAVETLSAASRRSVRERLAGRLDDPAEAARHYLVAGARARAHECALRAVAQAPSDRDRARGLALAARSAEPGAVAELRLRACTALLAADCPAEVLELAPGRDDVQPELRARALLHLARAHNRDDDPESARSAVAEALELAREPALRSELLAEAASLQIVGLMWNPARAVEIATEAVCVAEAARVSSARAHSALARAQLATGSGAHGAHFDEARELAREAGDVDAEFEAIQGQFTTRAFFGDMADAIAVAREGQVRALELGARSRELEFQGFAASFSIFSGDDVAGSIAELDQFLSSPIPPRHRDLASGLLALGYADLGELASATERIDAALAPGRVSPKGHAMLLWIKAEIDLLAGRFQDAVAAVEECGRATPSDYAPLFALAPLARSWAMLHLDRTPGPALPQPPFPSLAGSVPESEGLVAMSEGDFAAAAERFDAAASVWPGMMHRNELRCAWGAAEARRLAGDETTARADLLALEVRIEATGLRSLLGLVHRSLRALGVDRRQKSVQRGARISTRERQVLELVGQGLSSAEIASRLGIARSTVESAIRAAMHKLGATTRVQAAVLATGQPGG